jgi:plastocyanin
MVVGLLIAVPLAAIAVNLSVGGEGQSTTTVKATMPHMASTGMGGGVTASATQSKPVADQLTIVHMQKGCHDWSNGSAQMATMRLAMKPGQMLRIMNQDVDMHQLMQLAGPTMMMGEPMKEGQARSLTFTKPGTYKFDTKSLPMKGMPEVQTIGPDNHLRLTVTVA